MWNQLFWEKLKNCQLYLPKLISRKNLNNRKIQNFVKSTSDFFCKIVILTKFLPKMCVSKFPKLSHCVRGSIKINILKIFSPRQPSCLCHFRMEGHQIQVYWCTWKITDSTKNHFKKLMWKISKKRYSSENIVQFLNLSLILDGTPLKRLQCTSFWFLKGPVHSSILDWLNTVPKI